MPNWCNNTISIAGPTDKIQALWDKISETQGLLRTMVPMPTELEGTTSPTPQPGASNYKGPQPTVDGYDNWYDWSVARWGTKWDVDTEGLEFEADGDESQITGWFDSAWGPPLTAMQTYTEANPDVSIELFYHEPGMDFAGVWRADSDVYYENMSQLWRDDCEDPDFIAIMDHWDLWSTYEEWAIDEAEETENA